MAMAKKQSPKGKRLRAKLERATAKAQEKPIPKTLLDRYPTQVAEALAPLTINQRRFVVMYCSDCRGNAVLAAKRAGLGTKKASYISLASNASTLLQMPAIRRAVEAWMQAFAYTAAEVTWRIKDMADINPSPFFEVNAEGQLVLKQKMDADDWDAFNHWVKEIEVDAKTGRVTRLVLHDRMIAHRELAKILKLYSDQPIFAFNLYLQQMSDDQLMTELMSARSEEAMMTGRVAASLPSGGPVAVVGGDD